MITIDWPTGLWVTLFSLIAWVCAGEYAMDVVPFVVAALLAATKYGERREHDELQRRTDALGPKD
jgi:hypothetical protein